MAFRSNGRFEDACDHRLRFDFVIHASVTPPLRIRKQQAKGNIGVSIKGAGVAFSKRHVPIHQARVDLAGVCLHKRPHAIEDSLRLGVIPCHDGHDHHAVALSL